MKYSMRLLLAIIAVIAILAVPYMGKSAPVVRVSLADLRSNYGTAKLEFRNVLHTQESYEVRVFLEQPGADASTPTEGNKHYAGSLFFYGQGQYSGVGVEGLSSRTPLAQEFDLSPGASNTSPFTLNLDITSSLRHFANLPQIGVSFVAVDFKGNQIPKPDLEFESVSLIAN